MVAALHVRLVFVTQCRRGVLSERALAVLRASMGEVCRDFGQRSEVSEKLWGEHLWSLSYFAAPCVGAPLEILERYIDSQREPGRGAEAPLTRP